MVDWDRLSAWQQNRIVWLLHGRAEEKRKLVAAGAIIAVIVENGLPIRAAETTGEITSNLEWLI